MKTLQNCRIISMLCLVFFTTAFDSPSQNIANWNFNNSLLGVGTPFNLALPVTLGPAIGNGAFNGGSEYFGESGWPSGGINTSSYVEFSMSPLLNYILNVSSLTIRMRRSNTGSPSGSGPTAWTLRSSIDGFSSDLAAGTLNHNYSNYNVSLPALTSLTTIVTFRLYGYSTSVSPGGNSRLVLDNISVQGATGTLAVKFPAFHIQKSGNGAKLQWTAVNISAGTKMGVERSFNGTDFTIIHEEEETSAKDKRDYRFADHTSAGSKIFYRIRAVELSGTVSRTAISFIENNSANKLALLQIIRQGSFINAMIEVPARGNYDVMITAINGSLIYKGRLKLEQGVHNFSLPMRAQERGNFVISIFGGATVISKQFFY